MTTTLKIEGMSCGHCVKHVTDALTEISGVNKADVSLENKTATVDHDDGVTVAQMKEAIEEAGYEAE